MTAEVMPIQKDSSQDQMLMTIGSGLLNSYMNKGKKEEEKKTNPRDRKMSGGIGGGSGAVGGPTG